MLTGLGSVLALFLVAVPAFGVDVHLATLPAAIVTAALGAACLAALGLAAGSLVRTSEQAMPLAQLTFLPISFISGVWFPLDGRAGLGHDDRRHLPAQAHRRRLHRLLPRRRAGRGLRLGRPRGHRGLGDRRPGRGDAAAAPGGGRGLSGRMSRLAAQAAPRRRLPWGLPSRTGGTAAGPILRSVAREPGSRRAELRVRPVRTASNGSGRTVASGEGAMSRTRRCRHAAYPAAVDVSRRVTALRGINHRSRRGLRARRRCSARPSPAPAGPRC